MNCDKAFALLLVLSVVCSNAVGQSKVTDSLEQRLPQLQGKQKVEILNQLTYEFITHYNDKVVRYGNEAIRLSKQIKYIKGEAIAHTYRGVYEYLSGQFALAHQDLHRGLALSIQAGDRANQGYTLLQLGVCALEEVEKDSALFYFTKAYEIFKDSTNALTLSKIYRNMSALYGQRYQYDKQQLYLDRAIAIRRLLSDDILLADALILKAGNTLTSGDIATAEAMLDEAEKLVKDHYEDREDLNDVRHLRALIYFRKGRFDEAVVLLDSARNYYYSKSLIRKYITLLTDMGKVFSDRGEYELALNNLYDALRLSKEHGFEADTYSIRNRIGWVNFHLGDLTQALRLANEGLRDGPKRQLQGAKDSCQGYQVRRGAPVAEVVVIGHSWASHEGFRLSPDDHRFHSMLHEERAEALERTRFGIHDSPCRSRVHGARLSGRALRVERARWGSASGSRG